MKSKGRSSLIEWFKSLLIVLLSLSAIYLLWFSYTSDSSLDSLRNLFTPTPAATSVPDSAQLSSTVIHPVRLAVCQDNQRCGIQYDQAAADSAHADFSTLLSEAFSSAAAPRVISEQNWRTALGRTGIYLDYLFPVPMDLLSGMTEQGQGNPALTGSVRRICLAEGDNGGVALFYINETDGLYYTSQTTLSLTSHLKTAVSGFSPNGSLFAFEVAGMEALDPYTLLTTMPQARVYSAGNPLLTDSDRVSDLLTTLTFHAQNFTLDPIAGTQYIEGNDFLRLSPRGEVTFHTVGDSEVRFRIPDANTQNTLNYVTALANATAGAWCGQARLHLADVEQTDTGLVISFQYCLNGSLVSLPVEHAARFVVQNGAVTDFSLYLRSYSGTDQAPPLLPVLQAAAAMNALDANGRELTLLYQDSGTDSVGACWAAQ